MTKHGMRPPVGSEMEIFEDTNAVKQIYDLHLELIAGFRLGSCVPCLSVHSVHLWRLKIRKRWSKSGNCDIAVQYCGIH